MDLLLELGNQSNRLVVIALRLHSALRFHPSLMAFGNLPQVVWRRPDDIFLSAKSEHDQQWVAA